MKSRTPRPFLANMTTVELSKQLKDIESKSGCGFGSWLAYDNSTTAGKLREEIRRQVKVDFENVLTPLDTDNDEPGFAYVFQAIDIAKDKPTLPVAWCTCGGDWEKAVAFVIYIGVDGDLHAYVPLNGNCYDVHNNEAYGNSTDIPFEKYKLEQDAMEVDICMEFEPVGVQCSVPASTKPIQPSNDDSIESKKFLLYSAEVMCKVAQACKETAKYSCCNWHNAGYETAVKLAQAAVSQVEKATGISI